MLILANETSPCNCDLSLLKSISNQLHKGNCNRLQMRRETLMQAVVTFYFLAFFIVMIIIMVRDATKFV